MTVTFCVMLAAALAFAGSAEAATITAASCEYADVKAAVDAASAGGTPGMVGRIDPSASTMLG